MPERPWPCAVRCFWKSEHGQGWQAIGLESANDLVHGIAEAGGFGRPGGYASGKEPSASVPAALPPMNNESASPSPWDTAEDLCAECNESAAGLNANVLGYYELDVNGRKVCA